jgi:hypothetical protein
MICHARFSLVLISIRRKGIERTSYIKIGSMWIMLEEYKDSIDIIHGFSKVVDYLSFKLYAVSILSNHRITRYGKLKSTS